MMAPAAAAPIIPRFVLPQTGLVRRRVAAAAAARPPAPTGSVPASTSHRVFLRWTRLSPSRSSSSSTTSNANQRVLAKPERFNPPSHGSRLPKRTPPRHYGGELSNEELQAQARREYPGMMSPPGTRAYWFWHSRWIHVVITVVRSPCPGKKEKKKTNTNCMLTHTHVRLQGTLSGLAIWTFALNFKHTSPFADMLPPAEDYLRHPIASTRMLIEVVRLHEAHKSARIEEKRRRYIEDVAKRAAYRKAHGLPDEVGLFNQPMAKIRTDDDGGDKAGAAAAADDGAAQQQQQQQEQGEGQVAGRRLTEEERREVVKEVKGKWLGIF